MSKEDEIKPKRSLGETLALWKKVMPPDTLVRETHLTITVPIELDNPIGSYDPPIKDPVKFFLGNLENNSCDKMRKVGSDIKKILNETEPSKCCDGCISGKQSSK